MRKILITITLATALLPGIAFGHGIWLAQRTDTLAVVYGHLAEDGAYEPQKVKSVVGYAANGEKVDVDVIPGEKSVGLAPPEGALVLATTFDNGFWIKDAGGAWQNVGKTDVPGGTESHHPLKFNTHILGNLAGAPWETGAELEIVPLVDPIDLHKGDDLPVQVYLHGKPFAGAEVINDYQNDAHVTATADAEGKVVLKVMSEGLNVIAVEATHKTPEDLNVDEVYYNATLRSPCRTWSDSVKRQDGFALPLSPSSGGVSIAESTLAHFGICLGGLAASDLFPVERCPSAGRAMSKR